MGDEHHGDAAAYGDDKEEIFAEATSVYDSYVEALETEAFEALQAYARNLSERIIPRG